LYVKKTYNPRADEFIAPRIPQNKLTILETLDVGSPPAYFSPFIIKNGDFGGLFLSD